MAYRSIAPLLKDLGDQGFTVEETSDGWRVKSADGESTASIHESSIKRSTARSYTNLMAALKRIGFKEGTGVACAECGERFAKAGMIPKHRRIAHGVKTACPVCEQEFITPQAMGRHRKYEHVTVPDREPVALPELELEHIGEKKIRVPRGVSIRHVEEIQVMVDGAEELKAAADKMVAGYKELYKRYVDQKRRLERIESNLGKALNDL